MRCNFTGATRLRWGLGALAFLGVVALAQDRPGRLMMDEAPLDRVVTFPRADLQALFRRASEENLGVIRMLEGGEYNVNIRHFEDITAENFTMLTHPDTIDVWVVQEGSGTMITGGERVDGRYVGGEERRIDVGDLVFIPAGIPHGIKEARSLAFFNIRFPEHRN